MHKRLFIICILFMLTDFFSCKKDTVKSMPTQHTITYNISSNNYQLLSDIYYTDTSTVQVHASAKDSASGWSKSITTSYTPFIALLQIEGQNSSTNTFTYTLEIYVDGILKAMQQDSATKFNSFNTQASD